MTVFIVDQAVRINSPSGDPLISERAHLLEDEYQGYEDQKGSKT